MTPGSILEHEARARLQLRGILVEGRLNIMIDGDALVVVGPLETEWEHEVAREVQRSLPGVNRLIRRPRVEVEARGASSRPGTLRRAHGAQRAAAGKTSRRP